MRKILLSDEQKFPIKFTKLTNNFIFLFLFNINNFTSQDGYSDTPRDKEKTTQGEKYKLKKIFFAK